MTTCKKKALRQRNTSPTLEELSILLYSLAHTRVDTLLDTLRNTEGVTRVHFTVGNFCTDPYVGRTSARITLRIYTTYKKYDGSVPLGDGYVYYLLFNIVLPQEDLGLAPSNVFSLLSDKAAEVEIALRNYLATHLIH